LAGELQEASAGASIDFKGAGRNATHWLYESSILLPLSSASLAAKCLTE
jgi:hypothetical protein